MFKLTNHVVTEESTPKSVIITSIKDIVLIDKYPSAQYIALDRTIIHLHEEHDLMHVLDFCNLGGDFYDADISSMIANKWYRGKSGNDLSMDIFSMGLVLEYRLSEVLAHVIRYYSAFKGILEVYDELIVPDNIPKLLKDILLYIDNGVRFIHSDNGICEAFNFPLYRNVVSKVKPHWLSPIAIFLQKFSRKNLKNRALLFPGGIYQSEKNDLFLLMNSFNITKGYYLDGQFKTSVSLTDDVIHNDDIEIHVMSILAKYSKKFDVVLGKLILETIKSEYFLLKDDAVYMYGMYHNLLSRYEPKAVVVYSTKYTWHVMIMQVANKLNIPVIVVQDGITVYINKYNFPNDRSGRSALVKNYCVMSPLVQSLMANHTMSTINKVQSIPPLIHRYDHKTITKINKKTNKVLVLFNDPPVSSLLTEWDSRHSYIIDAVKSVLASNRKLSVVVKVKEGGDAGNNIKMLRMFLNEYGYDDVSIVRGQLYEQIPLVDLVVGGVGSAMIEVLYNNVPYYIFEPYYYGISDETLYTESILSSLDVVVSRTDNELRENIELGKKSFIDKKDLFYDTGMPNIDFDNLIC